MTTELTAEMNRLEAQVATRTLDYHHSVPAKNLLSLIAAARQAQKLVDGFTRWKERDLDTEEFEGMFYELLTPGQGMAVAVAKQNARRGLEQRWVAVEERLPEANTDVLIWSNDWLPDARAGIGEMGESGSWYVDYNGDLGIENVTHWMPLPSPPEAK